jgi:acyl-CoA synthetase (NDP forming)
VTGTVRLPDPEAALRSAFNPNAIAVVGASRKPGKMGHVALRALQQSRFPGRLYPVNPSAGTILGISSYPLIFDLPETPDFAIVAVPRPAVAQAVRDCAVRGVPVIQVLTAGYGETGTAGRSAEEELRDIARRHGSRIVGPNCVGTFSATARVTWTPQADFTPGGVSFISQSGGLAYDLLVGSGYHGLTFDKVVSIGNCADLDVADYLKFLRSEASTRVVGLYVEGPRQGRRMLDELTALTAVKPVLVLKGGRSDSASASVSSHTGQLAGSYAVWRAAIRQAGAIEVTSFAELVTGLSGLQSLPRGVGRRVALVGNGGGATVLASDSCAENGLAIAEASAGTRTRLASLLGFLDDYRPGAEAIVELPIDRLLADDGRLLARLVTALAEDSGVDVVILHVNIVPLVDRDNVLASMRNVLGRLRATEITARRPVLLALRTGEDVRLASIRQELASLARASAGLPTFADLDHAIACAGILASAADTLAGSRRVAAQRPGELAAPGSARAPSPAPGSRANRLRRACGDALRSARDHDLAALDEAEAKRLLAAFGLATPRGCAVPDSHEPPALPTGLGPPFVLKALTHFPLHKTRTGAVRVGIGSVDELTASLRDMRRLMASAGLAVHGYLVEELIPPGVEMIIGSIVDPTFGRVVMLGFGGIFVESLADVTIRVCPISAPDACAMLDELRGGELLRGAGGGADRNTGVVAETLMQLAGPDGLLQAVEEFVTEIDLNPVIIRAGRATVADARVVLRRRDQEG